MEYLLLCAEKGPEVPGKYRKQFRVHCFEHLAGAFLGPTTLRKKLQAGTFLLLPGMLDALLEDRKRNVETKGMKEILEAPAVLLVDTGLDPEIEIKIRAFSAVFGISCGREEINPDFYKLFLKTLILSLENEKLERWGQKAAEKSAFYAAAFEMLRELMHAENEKKAIEGITEVFKMLFAPGKLVYFSVKEGKLWKQGNVHGYEVEFAPERGVEREIEREIETKIEKEIETKIETKIEKEIETKIEKEIETETESKTLKTSETTFLESEANYLIEGSGDGFALKFRNNGETLGIIELQEICYPQYIEQYLSLALDIATICGLVISNSRRYSEIKNSRKIMVQYADVLKVINRILRHDINNQLNMINMALELYREKPDEKYISIALKAVVRGAGIIQQMGELETLVSKGGELNSCNIKEVAEELMKNYPVRTRVEGGCQALVDEAFPSVLDNIIRNAIIHGKSEQINILIAGEEKHCVIRIADYGTGIPDEIKTKVFEEGFKYGDTGNTGLGLYIVKKVIDRYGGSISVEDNQPQGTVFVIKLKCARQDEVR
ncbi:MAG: HAMP domain-containing sensor histidine kinase, partial [Methanosarcinaceae archaeon]|nr:HAMP domain-containing sensor histidine kinase [Methanosarcinaceae archaeon]